MLGRIIGRALSCARYFRARLAHIIAHRKAMALAAADGHDGEDVIACGMPTILSGDVLTDGPEYPTWFFYDPARQKRYGLRPLGPVELARLIG